MLACFTKRNDNAIPIFVVEQSNIETWLANQTPLIQNWLKGMNCQTEAGTVKWIPDEKGHLAGVFCCIKSNKQSFELGSLPFSLPQGSYVIAGQAAEDPEAHRYFAIAWGLGAYQFTKYKKALRNPAQLCLPAALNPDEINSMVESLYYVRDLINTPTEDMGPSELALAAKELAKSYGASFSAIEGQALLKKNYPAIYTVGRASDDPPQLIELRWGNPMHPKVTLVGKGVCFDSGGLDIKPSPYMLLMKKDMAGGAHVLGLARMIMEVKLPLYLRVLIPAVENVIAGNAYKPGDVIKSRQGLTIEVGNTDAEGRLVLADALAEAVNDTPALLIDISTLTGAARVALGPDLPAVFCNQDPLVNELIQVGERINDPMWRLPLFSPYREYLNSNIADINNNSSEPYGGAIAAALFLQAFVPLHIPWLHFDLMAWNTRSRPGRPQGGEAMVLRALFEYLKGRFREN